MGNPSDERREENSPEPGEKAPKDQGEGLYGQRPSKSHDDFVREEFRRLAKMTARERILEALRLDEEIRAALGQRTDEVEKEGPRA